MSLSQSPGYDPDGLDRLLVAVLIRAGLDLRSRKQAIRDDACLCLSSAYVVGMVEYVGMDNNVIRRRLLCVMQPPILEV